MVKKKPGEMDAQHARDDALFLRPTHFSFPHTHTRTHTRTRSENSGKMEITKFAF